MAKRSKATPVVAGGINRVLLAAIAQATAANQVVYVTKEEGEPLLVHQPALIQVNLEMIDPSNPAKVAARITAEGSAWLAANPETPAAPAQTTAPAASKYGIIADAELPASKRGATGGGAPTQYPFDQLEIGQSFFVPVSEKHDNPVKTLGSTVSSANMRYAEDTGEKRTVTRVKRGDGNKGLKDAAGNKIMETVQVPVYKFTRKFSIRSVEAGKTYGKWVAPANGALIARVPLDNKSE